MKLNKIFGNLAVALVLVMVLAVSTFAAAPYRTTEQITNMVFDGTDALRVVTSGGGGGEVRNATMETALININEDQATAAKQDTLQTKVDTIEALIRSRLVYADTKNVMVSYGNSEVQRGNTTAGADKAFTFANVQKSVKIENYSAADIYVAFDTAATGGSADLLIRAGSTMDVPRAVTVVHVFCAATQEVQILGLNEEAV